MMDSYQLSAAEGRFKINVELNMNEYVAYRKTSEFNAQASAVERVDFWIKLNESGSVR